MVRSDSRKVVCPVCGHETYATPYERAVCCIGEPGRRHKIAMMVEAPLHESKPLPAACDVGA